MSYEIDVIEVPRSRLMELAGSSWADACVVAEADPTLEVKSVIYFNPLVTPPVGCAWLRRHDNRAFLYLQNW